MPNGSLNDFFGGRIGFLPPLLKLKNNNVIIKTKTIGGIDCQINVHLTKDGIVGHIKIDDKWVQCVWTDKGYYRKSFLTLPENADDKSPYCLPKEITFNLYE